ncbi:hypothetical protein EPUS_07757 [Endocarpon pusillum Z07020]|uniref:Sugar phosphate transporter domain-containing protein n=1 Tax=Endocarpon pusillum (strain Z07020 / HMAS-L-300199) TaxID=1263415 RepID=U1HLD2_ENDPU|nr:uncharacterized protein EPUS_07757 [Endocarpon pusillum Z07020]ERF71085.1 hypothetical protein EPUS_07757 [Endocarpon pusillum Z07020]
MAIHAVGVNMGKYVQTGSAVSLLFYFSFNLALTLLNKLLLEKVKFPYLLTALHAGASWLGCAVILRKSSSGIRMQNIRLVDSVNLVLFSILYSVNIGISNVSLRLTSLSVHQLLRAISPAITALILRVFCRRQYTWSSYASLILVVFGVALATTTPSQSTHMSSTPGNVSGILLTLLGALLASCKPIAAAALQKCKSPPGEGEGGKGLNLSAMQLLHYISPLAFLQSILYAWIAGELRHLPSSPSSASRLDTTTGENEKFTMNASFAIFITLNGLVALGLNIASFEANRRVGALGITIAGNVKQVLVLVLDVVVNGKDDIWTWRMWIGVLGTVVGSCWFVVEEGRQGEKMRRGTVEVGMQMMEKEKEKEGDKNRVLEEGRAEN